jgi:hypothetical protein
LCDDDAAAIAAVEVSEIFEGHGNQMKPHRSMAMILRGHPSTPERRA